MNRENKLLFRKRHRHTVIYCWLLGLGIVLSLFAAVIAAEVFLIAPSSGLSPASWSGKLIFVSLLLALCIDLSVWLYGRHLVKCGANSKVLEPYTVEVKARNREEFYRSINECVKLERLQENVLYGSIEGKYNIRLFLFETGAYEKSGCRQVLKSAQRAAMDNFGLKNRMSLEKGKKEIWLRLWLSEHFTGDALNCAKENAAHGFGLSCGNLDVIIDTEKILLYIPAYNGFWYGGSAKYCFCVKKLLSWIRV